MTQIGFTLSSEEHGPRELVRYAKLAEDAGFDFLMVSDHYFPWVDRQGHSPFVWSVLGGIAAATERVPVGTGVTCPVLRFHPALVAQAAATTAIMLGGRFWLGLGTGENLNEHILAQRWPSADERLDMLEEAVEVIRLLWQGGLKSHRGSHFRVEDARVYDLPDEPPPILIGVKGDKATRLAARAGDGMIGVAPDRETLRTYEEAGGTGPRVGQIHLCWAEDEAAAKRTAYEHWPNAAIEGEAGVDLPMPRHFEQLAEMIDEDDVAERVPCGPDAERHLDAVRKYVDAGYDHVYLHQIGPDQVGGIRFLEQEVLPKLR